MRKFHSRTQKTSSRRLALSVFFVSVLLISTCVGKNPVAPDLKKNDFEGPEEYLENPSVKNAVEDSDFPIYEGNDPPRLAGDYLADAEITSTSPLLEYGVGAKITSKITLYNQTASGKISFKETLGSITVWASGGYITGENNDFTIWQESRQSGSEAGLPDDVTVYVSLLMSGYKEDDGDLKISGISIITRVITDNKEYDIDEIEGQWWMYEGTLSLQ